MWGQVDGMGALPMVGAIVAVARGRRALAGVLAVLAGLVKPQFGIAAFVLARARASPGCRPRTAPAGPRSSALASIATFLVVLLPLGLGPFALPRR